MNNSGARAVATTRAILAALAAMLSVSAWSVSAWAGSDDPFRLTADFSDLPAYFPAYLANGFVSTLSAPRGTEATPAYLVALMDYTR